eukprot:7386174-Prymnesium_polylepis.1
MSASSMLLLEACRSDGSETRQLCAALCPFLGCGTALGSRSAAAHELRSPARAQRAERGSMPTR